VELANLAGDTLDDVVAAAEHGIQRIRGTPHLAFSFLRHCGLSLWCSSVYSLDQGLGTVLAYSSDPHLVQMTRSAAPAASTRQAPSMSWRAASSQAGSASGYHPPLRETATASRRTPAWIARSPRPP
jgi:hypothetical protein